MLNTQTTRAKNITTFPSQMKNLWSINRDQMQMRYKDRYPWAFAPKHLHQARWIFATTVVYSHQNTVYHCILKCYHLPHSKSLQKTMMKCFQWGIAGTLTKDHQSLSLVPPSTIDLLCLKLMSKENNDAGWRPYPRWTYEINFWKGIGLPAEVTCLLCEMPLGTRTYPDPLLLTARPQSEPPFCWQPTVLPCNKRLN